MTFKMVTCTRVDSESSAGHGLSSVQAWLIDLVQDIKIGAYRTSHIVIVARNSTSPGPTLGCHSNESLARTPSCAALSVAFGNWNSVLFAIINSQFQVLLSFDCLVTELTSTFYFLYPPISKCHRRWFQKPSSEARHRTCKLSNSDRCLRSWIRAS